MSYPDTEQSNLQPTNLQITHAGSSQLDNNEDPKPLISDHSAGLLVAFLAALVLILITQIYRP